MGTSSAVEDQSQDEASPIKAVTASRTWGRGDFINTPPPTRAFKSKPGNRTTLTCQFRHGIKARHRGSIRVFWKRLRGERT
jgi:hypothetical protein